MGDFSSYVLNTYKTLTKKDSGLFQFVTHAITICFLIAFFIQMP